jgi:2'-5' RNA ligase
VRLFVAFELPEPVRGRIAERVDRLRPGLPPASWVPVERLHLTVAFLGETEATRLAAIDGALAPVFASSPPLRFRLGGAGTFPPGRPARVAWIAVEEGGAPAGALTAGALTGIERRARHALAAALQRPLDDRPYHAHVTMARPRRPWGRAAVAAFRDACAGVEGEWDARRAVLMESRLGSGGAQYAVRQEYPLGEGDA